VDVNCLIKNGIFVYRDPKAMTIKFILIGLEELLANPNPFDPLDIIVGVQLKNTPKIFDETARHWTALYAGGIVSQ